MASIDRVMALSEELKKKKKNQDHEISQSTINTLDLANELQSGNKNVLKDYMSNYKNDFDAPVRKKDEERSWFRKGLFEDGYDMWDISKTILGTASDVYGDLVGGALKIGEGAIDTGAYLVGGAAKLTGNDDFAEKTKKFIERDLISESKAVERATNYSTIGMVNNLLTGNYEASNPFAPFSDEVEDTSHIESSSVLGDRSDSLVQSAGQLAGTIGLQAVGVPWWLTTGVASYGGEVQQAFQKDATYGEAGFSGLVSAGAEILTEKISGGISFGGRTLDETWKKPLMEKISSKTIQTLTKFGLDVVTEGAEEVLTEVISNVGKKLSYEDDKTWGEMLTSEEALDSYLEAFIGGAVLGGGFNVGRVSNSLKTGRDYDTGLTANEQAVVDSEIARRTDGKTLTNKQIKKIEAEVKEDLQKGYISTDTIESTLGGDTFNSLKSLRDNKTNLETQIKELENKPNAEITVKEMEQLNALREQFKAVDTNTLETQLQSEMGQKIQSDGYLQRSYQEKAKRSKEFTYEAAETDSEFRRGVMESTKGKLNDTTRSHETAEALVKLSEDRKMQYKFTNNAELKDMGLVQEGKTANGLYVVEKDGSREILVNTDSKKYVEAVLVHETAHDFQTTSPETYTKLVDITKQFAEAQNDYSRVYSEVAGMYKNVKGANIEEEVTSRLLEDYLGNKDFVKSLTTKEPNIVKKIIDEIKYLVKKFTAGSPEARKLLELQHELEKTYREAYKQTTATETTEGTKYSVSERTIQGLDGYTVNDVEGIVYDYVEAKIEEYNFDVDDIWGVYLHGSRLRGNARTDSDLDAVVFYIGEADESDIFNVINDENNQLEIDGLKVDINPISIDSYSEIDDYIARSEAYDKEVLGNVKYSLDNQGRELSEGQIEYFKDSKVRDEDGNLLVMYHGSVEEFNVFDKDKIRAVDYDAPFNGFWFSNDKNTSPAMRDAKTTKEVYLDIKNPAPYNVYKSVNKKISEELYSVGNPFRDASRSTNDELRYRLQEMGYDGIHWESQPNIDWEVFEENGRYTYQTVRGNYYTIIKDGDYIELYYGKNEDSEYWEYETSYLDAEDFKRLHNDEVWVAFESNQIKNVDNTNPTNDPDIRYSLSEDSEGNELKPNVIKWAENSKARDSEGRLKVVYHGSPMGEFTVFNKHMASPEGDWGAGFYLTDNESDVESNYADGGADFENKVARIAERIQEEHNIDYEDAEQQAREQLYKGYYRIDAYANIKNPAIVGETYILDSSRYAEEYNVEDYDSEEDYYADVDELVNADIENIIWNIEKEYDFWNGTDDIKNVLYEAFYEGGIEIQHLKDRLNELYLEADEGMVANDVARIIIESLGYDGIIDPTVSGKWNMNMEEGTTHYIVFKPNQIKSITNENPTSDPDINLSLSNESDIAPTSTDNQTATQDIRLQVEEAIAPLQEEIAALREQINPTSEAIQPDERVDEFAPAPQEVVEQQNSEAFNTIEDADMPSEIEDTTPETEELTPTDSLFDTRDYAEVGDRKIKAYQYENPEVRPFFQQAAREMMSDLNESIKGERYTIGDTSQIGGGDYYFSGTKRYTTEDIAELLDGIDGKYKYTYDEIHKGLKAIIEDNGKENNAASKRIEFYLDKRLREGYTDLYGYKNPPDTEYLDLLRVKGISDYYSNLPIGEAPVEEASNTEVVEDIAPVRNSTGYTTIGGQQHLNLNNLGETLQDNNVDWDSVENTSLDNARQLTIDGTEEDLVKKTKKELRKALLGTEAQKEFITDALDNAKNRSMAFMNNTDTIRNTELVFGREAGRMINEVIFQKEIDNEADSIKWQNKERDEIKALGIKARSKESAAVQKYGEKQYVDDAGNVFAYGDTELASEFPDVATQNKIKRAAQVIRSKYDTYIDEANKVLTKLGFDPIKKRNDYMRHFQELNDVFSRYGIPFNAQNMQEHTLPTDINGLTEFWSPQKNYFANMQQRKGLKTTYDAITGVDGYIGGIANLIYHTEDIQRGRAFEELIRETYGEDKGFDNLDNLPDELKQLRAEKIQDNHLSNYAAWVHEWTNNVAGKKNKIDRSVESVFGRKAFSFLDQTRKQVGANMIGFNLSSSLTNLIAPVQAMAKTNKLAVVKGTADTIKNIFIKDNFMEKNRFLTSRMGTDMISKNAWQKIQDAGYVFMKGMDWFSSNQIVRSKYYELRAKGMSEAQAHAEAGQFAARIMGDRTKGANAQIYNSKLLGLVTQFQLEVNNQLYSAFYDTYHESKENARNNAVKTAAGMTFTLGQLFAFTHLFGKTFESIAGYNPTFDVIGMLMTAIGWGDDDEEKTTSERLKEAADQLVDALPYVNILTGGGRIPVASGIPNVVGVMTGGKDQYGNELTLEDEMKKLLYLIPPTGGNQVKKTTQGLGMFDEDLPVSGSYTDSGNLRFPVEDTPLNRLQAGLFGQWASENARNYFDNERQPLKEKQIQEYADLDLPIKDYWEYREGLKEQNTTQEKFDYINSLDVSSEQKNIMINNAIDRKDAIDMSNYDDFGGYEEFDYATKNPDKYRVIEQIDTFDNYNSYKEDIASIKEQFSTDNGYDTKQRKAAVQQYIQSLNLSVPQKIMLEKMAGGYSIKSYASYMQGYIESLPLTAEEKQAIHSQLFD